MGICSYRLYIDNIGYRNVMTWATITKIDRSIGDGNMNDGCYLDMAKGKSIKLVVTFF